MRNLSFLEYTKPPMKELLYSQQIENKKSKHKNKTITNHLSVIWEGKKVGQYQLPLPTMVHNWRHVQAKKAQNENMWELWGATQMTQNINNYLFCKRIGQNG